MSASNGMYTVIHFTSSRYECW